MIRKTALISLYIVLLACGDSASDKPSATPDETLGEAVSTYSQVVLATYEDALSEAEAMAEAIDGLLDEPDAQALQDARDAWRAAREPYLLTETFRFYDGPIDDPDDGVEGLLNAWPLDENYIDYVEGDAQAGIINDPSVPMTADTLMSLNEQGGEKNIATGYHAIEFLLWGQDRSEDGSGERPYTDFVDGGTADNQERRAAYLATASDLLVENLAGLVDAWAEDDEDNYRAQFEAEEPTEALRRILTGMIVLSGFETGGERLQAALDTGDQEDEHSCFSDNTHRDMIQDIRGMQDVYLGRYERTDGSTVRGTSIMDVVAEVDEELAQRVRDRIAESLSLAEALEPPFDREIALDNPAGRERVAALIDSLREQEDDLFDVFSAFDLTVSIPE